MALNSRGAWHTLAHSPSALNQVPLLRCGSVRRVVSLTEQSAEQNLKKDSVKSRIAQLEQRFAGVKLIVGVDRLDYIKGVPQKLHALELFLTQHPEWIGKVSIRMSKNINEINVSGGGVGTTRRSFPPRRRGISELAIDGERVGRTH